MTWVRRLLCRKFGHVDPYARVPLPMPRRAVCPRCGTGILR